MSDHLEQPAAAPDHDRDHGSPQWTSAAFVTRMVFLIVLVIVIAAVAFLGETLGSLALVVSGHDHGHGFGHRYGHAQHHELSDGRTDRRRERQRRPERKQREDGCP